MPEDFLSKWQKKLKETYRLPLVVLSAALQQKISVYIIHSRTDINEQSIAFCLEPTRQCYGSISGHDVGGLGSRSSQIRTRAGLKISERDPVFQKGRI